MNEPNVREDLPPIIADHLPEIVAVARRHGVARLEVFGSVMTDRYDPTRSDVDFLVRYPDDYQFGPFLKRFQQLEEDLGVVLDSPVDLVMESPSLKDRFVRSIAPTRHVVFDGR